MPRFPFAFPFLAAATFAGSSPAQDPTLRAQGFWFDDYRTIIQLDMKAVRDTGVWDEMSGSLVKLIGPSIEGQLGFAIDRLDRVTSVRAARDVEGARRRFREITTIEGNGDLGTPADIAHGRYEPTDVGEHVLYEDQWSDGDGLTMVKPELRVHGPKEVLREVLEGKPHGGLPSADVLAFTAGQKKVLFHFVLDARAEDEPRRAMMSALPDVQWPEGDDPTFVCGRLRVTGDEDDPHVLAELIVRHGTAGEGLAVTEKAVSEAIEELTKQKEARLFRPVLKKIEHSREGTDAVWRVDLGRARDFGGLVGMLAPFMFVARSVEAAPAVQVEVVEEVEVPPPPPPPAAKPKPAGGGNGGGNGGGGR